jgi:hypothetical protein
LILHLPHNFMILDLAGSLIATLTFTLVLYAPGYLTAHATNLFGFRQLPFASRSLWAIATSFIVAPIVSYFIGLSLGLNGICWTLSVAATLTAILLYRGRTPSSATLKNHTLPILLILGWTAFVLLMLVDFQSGHKLYFSVVTADQSYRIAFTDAVVRTGVPPANPLYFDGVPAPMHYYYFWYVLCAAVVKIAHVSARQAFIASTIWAGFGLLVTLKLFATHFFHWTRRQTTFAFALLAVTGADLIPALGNLILQPSLNADIEWWSVDPIDSWPDSLLWVPHHVASVLCCLLAFLFLWRTLKPLTAPLTTPRTARRTSLRWPLALSAIAFASAFGLSIYVAFGFALMMLAWLLYLALTRDPNRLALTQRIAVAGLLSFLLLIPYLRELCHTFTAACTTQPTQLFALSVRRMIDSGLITRLPLFASLNRTHPILLDQTLRLLLLIPGLAMELGLYAAVLFLLLRAQRTRIRTPSTALHPQLTKPPLVGAGLQSRHQTPPPPGASTPEAILPSANPHATALFFTLTGLVLTLFLSSSVITNNDFGYRAVMLPQFFLLLLTADLLGSWQSTNVPHTTTNRRLLHTLLILGVAGSLYAAVLLRAWLPREAHRTPQSAELDFTQLPSDAFQIRSAFDELHRLASPNAVVAFRPIDPEQHTFDEVVTPNEFYQRLLVANTGRQILNAEWKCAVHFGGSSAHCAAIQTRTTQLYAAQPPSADWAQAFCSHFGVRYLALSHRDPAWPGLTGWPATLPVIARQPTFRIVQCAPDR